MNKLTEFEFEKMVAVLTTDKIALCCHMMQALTDADKRDIESHVRQQLAGYVARNPRKSLVLKQKLLMPKHAKLGVSYDVDLTA